MTGQPMEWNRFGMFTFISWLMVLISQSLGFIIGAWFSVIVSIKRQCIRNGLLKTWVLSTENSFKIKFDRYFKTVLEFIRIIFRYRYNYNKV